MALLMAFPMGILWPDLKHQFALFPRSFNYLLGIITTIFVHKDLEHLSSNYLPFFVAIIGLFYFYKNIALKVTLIAHLGTGILTWCFARSAFHIGASGMVYALVFFVVISGVIRKNKKLSVFALICLVFQSGLIWGVFPLEESISWESHLMGGIVGSFLAIAFRHQGPQNHESIYEGEASAQEDEYLNL